MIKQKGSFNGIEFEEGDILKITLEKEGTKNLIIGKFIMFTEGSRFLEFFSGSRKRVLAIRFHTMCEYGIINIYENEITKLEVLKNNKTQLNNNRGKK